MIAANSTNFTMRPEVGDPFADAQGDDVDDTVAQVMAIAMAIWAPRPRFRRRPG
jgi:hypothetical protein